MHLLIHTQPFLLSFESITWRWSKELTMICSIYAPLFAISGPVSMIPTVGTLSLFHFREATRSLFLYRVLRLIHGYLLQLLLRHRLLQKIPTFRRIDPFLLMTKRGRDFMELSMGVILGVYVFVFIWVFIHVLFICGHVVFDGHVFLHCSTYFIAWNLFWGWHEPLYGQISFMISLLSLRSYVSLSFCWYIWYISSVCVVCGMFVFFLCIPCEQTIYHLFWRWRLLAGWRKPFVHTPL